VFEFLGTDALTVLLQVVLIDLVLAGDNAIVIGLAAAGLPEAQRGKDSLTEPAPLIYRTHFSYAGLSNRLRLARSIFCRTRLSPPTLH
jgi:hypothetical protein